MAGIRVRCWLVAMFMILFLPLYLYSFPFFSTIRSATRHTVKSLSAVSSVVRPRSCALSNVQIVAVHGSKLWKQSANKSAEERKKRAPFATVCFSTIEKCCTHTCDWQARLISRTNQRRDALIGQRWFGRGLKSKLFHTEGGPINHNILRAFYH